MRRHNGMHNNEKCDKPLTSILTEDASRVFFGLKLETVEFCDKLYGFHVKSRYIHP